MWLRLRLRDGRSGRGPYGGGSCAVARQSGRLPGTTPRTRPASWSAPRCGYLCALEIYSVADEPITARPGVRFIERRASERTHQQYLSEGGWGSCPMGIAPVEEWPWEQPRPDQDVWTNAPLGGDDIARQIPQPARVRLPAPLSSQGGAAPCRRREQTHQNAGHGNLGGSRKRAWWSGQVVGGPKQLSADCRVDQPCGRTSRGDRALSSHYRVVLLPSPCYVWCSGPRAR